MKEILLSSSVLILVILLIRVLFRERISRKLMYSLWLLAAIRLLVPFHIGASSLSILTLADRAEQSAPVQSVITRVDTAVRPPQTPEMTRPPRTEQNVPPETAAPHADSPETAAPHADPTVSADPTQEAPIPAQPTQPQKAPLKLAGILKGIWIAGAVLMGGWFCGVNYRYARKLRKPSSPIPCDESPVPVRISKNAVTPCLIGILSPVIYLPEAFAADDSRRRHILAHELTHLRRKDNFWSLIRCLCLCIYWFDPLVWAAAYYSKQDCELACDEGALRRLPEAERLSYGRTLVDTVAQSNQKSLFLANTAMFGSGKSLKERVKAIARKKHFTVIAAAAVAVIAAFAIIVTCTGAKKADPQPTEPTDAATEPATEPSAEPVTEPTAVPTEPAPTEAPTEPDPVVETDYPAFPYVPVARGEEAEIESRVLDAYGNDVTGELRSLWERCVGAYNIYGNSFRGDGERLFVGNSKFWRISNYDEVVDSTFTAEGLAAFEEKMYGRNMLYLDASDGAHYLRGEYGTGGRYVFVDIKRIAAAENELQLLTGCYWQEMGGGMYSYITVEWTARRENGRWLVSRYPYGEADSSDWDRMYLRHGDIHVEDAQGQDITSQAVSLWYRANSAYLSDGMVFDCGNRQTIISEQRDNFYRLKDYEEVMSGIFTEQGRLQYEAAVFSGGYRPLLNYGGKYYRLFSYEIHNYGRALSNIRVVSADGDRVELEVTYREFASDGLHYTPCTVPMTLARQDGEWLVDAYTHPDSIDEPNPISWAGTVMPEDPNDILILDENGQDITAEVVQLWVDSNLAYSAFGFRLFDTDMDNGGGQYFAVRNYRDAVSQIFTSAGAAQYEKARIDGKDLVKMGDGGEIKLLDTRSSSFWYDRALLGMDVISSEGNRLVIEVRYRTQTAPNSVQWTIVKDGERYKVEDYLFPGASYR